MELSRSWSERAERIQSAGEYVLGVVNDRTKDFLIERNTERDLQYLKKEITAGLKIHSAPGVLIARYISYKPDPGWIGLIVEGYGASLEDALAAWEEDGRKRREQYFGLLCTSNNPVGMQSTQFVEAIPAERDMSYNRQVNERIFDILKMNPANLSAPDNSFIRIYHIEKEVSFFYRNGSVCEVGVD